MGQTQGGGNGDFGGETDGGGGGPWKKLLLGGVKGGLSGFSDMEKQNQMMRQGGPPMQVPMAQQPQVQLPMGNQPFGQQPQRRGPNDLNFYGQG